MTDFTWDISFQLTGTYQNNLLQQTPNVPATVTGTIVTDIDSGFLNVEGDFISWSFTYSAPSVGFAGSASGGPTIISLFGNVLSASGDTLSYVFDPNIVFANHIFFNDSNDFFEQVDFGISMGGDDFVQGDILLRDGLVKSDLFDATVLQPFQIGTEVVATLADVSEVGTSEINIDLSSIFNVSGDVTISDNDQLVSIDLSNLLSVGGNFTLTDNGALLMISLPSLTSVGGNVDVSGDTSATAINLGSLSTVTGNIDVSGDTSATAINLGSLSTVTGNVDVSGDTSATAINLGSLGTVTGNVDVSGDTSVVTIDLSALLQAGAIVISDNGVITLDLGALVQAGGDVSIANNTHLLTVDLPSLSSTGGSVDIAGDTSATHVNLDRLGTVGGDLTISGDTSATSVDLGNLNTTGGDVSLIGDTSLTSVNLSSLNSTGGSIDLSGDTSATNVNLNNLTTTGGDVSLTDDSSVTNVDLGSLNSTGGSVDLAGDSSATDLNLGSLDTTGGNVTITSGADATLDASALGPGGGTVKLIGENLTTSITLGDLAHMDGALTISSADGVTLTSHAGLTELDITGTGHDDILIGSATAANVIDAGAGNDMMSGGAAADTFVFDFSVSQHQQFHHDFVSLAGVTSVTVGDTIYFRPAATASITAWSNWNSELTSWANSQPDNTGGDHFNAFTNSNPAHHGSSNTVGTIQLVDGYFDNYTTTVTSVAGDGFDTITNFANQALTGTNGGAGNDVLLFEGLSNDKTAPNYWGDVLSSTTANGNTIIHVHDVAHGGADVSSVTLLGVTTDVASLVHNGAIQFDSGFHLA